MSASPAASYIIRCVAEGGATRPFLSRLAREQGVWSFFYNGSRSAMGDHSARRARVAHFRENEEISILVDGDRLDAILAFCVRELGLSEPGRGALYVTRVEMARSITVPADV